MRAASNSLGKNITDLENTFCQPETNSTIAPQADATVYANAAIAFDALI